VSGRDDPPLLPNIRLAGSG